MSSKNRKFSFFDFVAFQTVSPRPLYKNAVVILLRRKKTRLNTLILYYSNHSFFLSHFVSLLNQRNAMVIIAKVVNMIKMREFVAVGEKTNQPPSSSSKAYIEYLLSHVFVENRMRSTINLYEQRAGVSITKQQNIPHGCLYLNFAYTRSIFLFSFFFRAIIYKRSKSVQLNSLSIGCKGSFSSTLEIQKNAQSISSRAYVFVDFIVRVPAYVGQ